MKLWAISLSRSRWKKIDWTIKNCNCKSLQRFEQRARLAPGQTFHMTMFRQQQMSVIALYWLVQHQLCTRWMRRWSLNISQYALSRSFVVSTKVAWNWGYCIEHMGEKPGEIFSEMMMSEVELIIFIGKVWAEKTLILWQWSALDNLDIHFILVFRSYKLIHLVLAIIWSDVGYIDVVLLSNLSLVNASIKAIIRPFILQLTTLWALPSDVLTSESRCTRE